jgi:hypothetical protein
MADEILNGLKGIRNELKAVQDQMAGLDAGSQQFIKLSEKAGQLRDKMKDVKEAVNAQAGPAIVNFGNNLSMARGQLMELDLEGFSESLKRVGGNISGINLKSFKDGLMAVGDGLVSIGRALLTNPIFLVAAAIAGAIAAFTYFTEKQKEAAEELAKQREKDFQYYKKENELRVIQAQGAADQIYRIRMEELKREQAYHWAVLKVAKESHDQGITLTESFREKEKVSQEKYNEIRIEMEKLTQERLNALNAKRFELDKQYSLIGLTERQKAFKILEDEYNQQLRQLGELGASEEDVHKLSMIFRERRSKLEKQYAEEDKKQIREVKRDELERIQSKDIAQITSTDNQIQLQTTLTQVTQTEEEKRTMAERKAAEERREIWNAAWYAKYELASATTDAMINLNNALTESGLISAEKGFKIGKGLSIAQTTIATIQGVQNALSAVTTIPDPFGTALKIANAVSIGAAGAANIAKIAKTQFQAPNAGVTPTAPSGGGGGGGGAMSAPSGQSPSALNLSFLQGNVSAAPLQTYVLAGQVSNAQQAEFKIKNTASILGGG